MTSETMNEPNRKFGRISFGESPEEVVSERSDSHFIESTIAAVVLMSLSWLIVPLILICGLVQGFPVFYRQSRQGFGREFEILKLRTLKPCSEKTGLDVVAKNDERVTRFGKILRRSKLDEIVQLWNVFRGDMGFFGPRPMPVGIVAFCRDNIPGYDLRHTQRPGLTGLVQALVDRVENLSDDPVEAYAEGLAIDLLYIEWRREKPLIDVLVALATVFPPVKSVLRRCYEARVRAGLSFFISLFYFTSPEYSFSMC
jgi:lipopolysaccharide/colanic/teichoic acid biosynthesis glycosyltransferase